MSTNWLFASGSVSCYPASIANFILFTDENVYSDSTKQDGGIKSGIWQSKNSTISQAVRAVHCLAERCKS